MDFDFYKLYLAIDYEYKDILYCESLEQVEYELNNATGYNKYIVIGHNIENSIDFPVAYGDIELNRPRTRKR